MGQLEARAPNATTSSVVGETAIYPGTSYDIATGINGSISSIIQVMEFIVMQEPTLYNSETKEFLWGPYDNENDFGTVAAYIRDAGENEDFRYQYVLMRGVDNDLATMTPFIYGGATPDPNNEDHGAGITMWDFEANYQFEQANDDNPEATERGRFITVYAKGQDGDNEVAFAVAAFRNFNPDNDPNIEPVDLDYLYGHVDDPDGNTLDFMDWQANFNIDEEPERSAVEDVGVRMAFVNSGIGRAEADAMNGDLEDGQTARVTECWDTSINQTYLRLETTGGTDNFEHTEGELTDCGLFQDDLSTLGIPALEDLDQGLMTALDELAENGIPN